MERVQWYQVGRRLYYNKNTGVVLYDAGQREGTDPYEHDFEFDTQNISEEPENIGYIDLEFNQYFEEFRDCVSYSINVTNKSLIFAFKNEDTIVKGPTLEQRVSDLEDALLLQIEAAIGGIL